MKEFKNLKKVTVYNDFGKMVYTFNEDGIFMDKVFYPSKIKMILKKLSIYEKIKGIFKKIKNKLQFSNE